jgi:acetyl-CoA carboxylase carboxyl transferase subunit beta
MRRLLPFRDRPTVEHQVYDLPARESCDRCDALLEGEPDFTHFRICPVCGRHFAISASRRIAYLVDPDTFEERWDDLYSTDPLDFVDEEPYLERLTTTRERTGRSDGMICGTATIGGEAVVLAVLDFTFLGGSMGVVVGERLARAAELAASKKRPLIAAVASGGARMQEGMLSLLQMGKTASSIAALKAEGAPFIAILGDPTTGGVLASFASLADVIVAEPEALIGFAGPRVVEQALGRPLPEGSHTSEFQLAHGMIDAIVARPDAVHTKSPTTHGIVSTARQSANALLETDSEVYSGVCGSFSCSSANVPAR